jgi:hypothetical protein
MGGLAEREGETMGSAEDPSSAFDNTGGAADERVPENES